MSEAPLGLDSTVSATHRDAAPPRPLWQIIFVRPETLTFILLVFSIFAGGQLSPYFLDIRYILESPTAHREESGGVVVGGVRGWG